MRACGHGFDEFVIRPGASLGPYGTDLFAVPAQLVKDYEAVGAELVLFGSRDGVMSGDSWSAPFIATAQLI